MTDSPVDEHAALSADIKLLGGLLGAIIKEQNGEDAFELVEAVRAAAKARRNGDEESEKRSQGTNKRRPRGRRR